MTGAKETQSFAPIRTSVLVKVPVETAFEFFASEIGRWWPLGYTFSGDRFDTAEIEPRVGGRWLERDVDGHVTGWGEVRVFEWPGRLVLSFAISPERAPEAPERASEVEIRFASEGHLRTRVAIEHRQIERHGPGAERLHSGMASRQGWPLILASYARAVRGRAE